MYQNCHSVKSEQRLEKFKIHLHAVTQELCDHKDHQCHSIQSSLAKVVVHFKVGCHTSLIIKNINDSNIVYTQSEPCRKGYSIL